ncbi:hypothetical protein Gotur_026074 [Gossypium turneri]
MKLDKRLFRALAQFSNPAYSCFTFGRVDLVPTLEEYTALLRCSKIQLDKRVTPVPVILAETFRSLNACRRVGEGRFIGCPQLLLAWFHSHFWKVDKVSYRNLQEGDIEWRAPWLLPSEILYRCGDFD